MVEEKKITKRKTTQKNKNKNKTSFRIIIKIRFSKNHQFDIHRIWTLLKEPLRIWSLWKGKTNFFFFNLFLTNETLIYSLLSLILNNQYSRINLMMITNDVNSRYFFQITNIDFSSQWWFFWFCLQSINKAEKKATTQKKLVLRVTHIPTNGNAKIIMNNYYIEIENMILTVTKKKIKKIVSP